MKRILTIVLCLFLYLFGFTQSEKDSIQVLQDEGSELTERKLPNDLNKKYSNEEFNYEIKTGESQNLIARFLRWLSNGLGDIFGINISPEVFKILQYLIYFLMGGLVIYLIVRLLVNEKFNSIFTKKAKSIIDIDLAEQHIESLDLEALLQGALEDKNYRLAIRYHYLRILKRLSQANLIEWHFDKTNSDYQSEIAKPNLKSGFKEVSYLYDYIWYGEQPIDELSYEKAHNSFKSLNNSIAQ
ncbi:DUF4129 domain-containing protein [Croceitalea rosinachiae]|uniref:DUF4129 domain-containing protein n=1 Tax=Croceitalea rosinachiae TaxID=3075596 RepID=A0ABU3AG73_9FLAO|nr:DUF4129 domain-containing protein [Croceitalea sp. F388]MDT0608552.1 DUF4129 domain-containing protein [Croceitalea sp. F388]